MYEQTKPPLRRVYATDFEVEVDGVTYRPHASEWVEFSPLMSVGEFLVAATSYEPPNNPVSEDEIRSAADAVESAIRQLETRLASWNFTDRSGRPIPQPRDGGLRALDLAEIHWLQGAVAGSRGTSGDPNAGSPSTSPSTGEAEGELLESGGSPESAKSLE